MGDNWLIDTFNFFGKLQEIRKTNLEIKALKKSAKIERESLELSRDMKQLMILGIILTAITVGCGLIQIIIAILK